MATSIVLYILYHVRRLTVLAQCDVRRLSIGPLTSLAAITLLATSGCCVYTYVPPPAQVPPRHIAMQTGTMYSNSMVPDVRFEDEFGTEFSVDEGVTDGEIFIDGTVTEDVVETPEAKGPTPAHRGESDARTKPADTEPDDGSSDDGNAESPFESDELPPGDKQDVPTEVIPMGTPDDDTGSSLTLNASGSTGNIRRFDDNASLILGDPKVAHKNVTHSPPVALAHHTDDPQQGSSIARASAEEPVFGPTASHAVSFSIPTRPIDASIGSDSSGGWQLSPNRQPRRHQDQGLSQNVFTLDAPKNFDSHAFVSGSNQPTAQASGPTLIDPTTTSEVVGTPKHASQPVDRWVVEPDEPVVEEESIEIISTPDVAPVTARPSRLSNPFDDPFGDKD